MKKNIGTQDRLLRAGVGLLFLALAMWFKSWILFGIALFSFFEAVAGWCLYYQLIGKNSCPLE